MWQRKCIKKTHFPFTHYLWFNVLLFNGVRKWGYHFKRYYKLYINVLLFNVISEDGEYYFKRYKLYINVLLFNGIRRWGNIILNIINFIYKSLWQGVSSFIETIHLITLNFKAAIILHSILMHYVLQ